MAGLKRKKTTQKGRRGGPKRRKTGGTTRTFVPRSFGTPLAITERKYYDSIKTTANFTSAAGGSFASAELDPGTVNTLFAPTTGDDFNNRSGRKVQVIQIKIRGLIQQAVQAAQTTADPIPVVRMLLVQDTQTNTAQLNSEDVLGNAVTSPIFAFQNPAFFGRFKVLKDKVFNIPVPFSGQDAAGTFVQGSKDIYFKWNIKFKKPVVVHFNSTNGGTVADIVDNSWHIIGAQSENAGMQCSVTYQARTTFLDL